MFCSSMHSHCKLKKWIFTTSFSCKVLLCTSDGCYVSVGIRNSSCTQRPSIHGHQHFSHNMNEMNCILKKHSKLKFIPTTCYSLQIINLILGALITTSKHHFTQSMCGISTSILGLAATNIRKLFYKIRSMKSYISTKGQYDNLCMFLCMGLLGEGRYYLVMPKCQQGISDTPPNTRHHFLEFAILYFLVTCT